jgi:cation transporter-like permease
MRIYDPLSIALLGVNLMTGAFAVTNYKAALGPAFFTRMGLALAWKLFFAFLLINLAAYIAFGIGHRLVSRVHWGEPLDAAWVDSMLKRLQASTILALFLLGVIVWIALGMTTV